jgi:hypothetical protein
MLLDCTTVHISISSSEVVHTSDTNSGVCSHSTLPANAVQGERERVSGSSCGIAQMAVSRTSLNSLNDDVLRRILIMLPSKDR